MPTLKTKEIRELLSTFLTDAVGCASSNPSQIRFERMRLTEGVLFNVSDKVIDSQGAVIDKLLRILGPIRGHKSELEPEIWKLAAEQVVAQTSAFPQALLDSWLDEIESRTKHLVHIIKPCNNIRLLDGIKFIKVGPVSIFSTKSHLSTIRNRCPSVKFTIDGTSIRNLTGLEVTLPQTVWEVELAAAKAVREEEAAWLIDVALSLLRLGVSVSNRGRMAPGIGKIEADPIEPSNSDHNRLTIGPGTNYSIGGWSMPSTYELGRKAKRSLQNKSVLKRIEVIFSPPKSSVAERFSQGLGWLTRGRKSADRPTRLLYFFTAIEALLSDSDKTAPVVQTVARHAAVILSENNKIRSEIAKDIRALYGMRSSLVHTGKRGIYDQDSNTIQYIAELLFYNVWKRATLESSHSDFVQKLSKASYGLKLGSNI